MLGRAARTRRDGVLFVSPAGFSWDFGIDVYHTGDFFQTSFDVASMAPSGAVVYVDLATGDNSNEGTSESPLATLREAVRIEATVIYLRPGDYAASAALDGVAITHDCSIIKDPDSNGDVIISGSFGIKAEGNCTLYVEGLDVDGGTISHYATAEGQSALLLAKDCTSMNSPIDGFALKGANSVLQNCSAIRNRRDGFNYHELYSTQCRAIEINCTATENGITGDGSNDNGSSMHEAGSIVRIGGLYERNYGPNIVDIGTSESLILGSVALDSLSPNENNGYGIYLYNGWVSGAVAIGNTVDVAVYGGGDFRIGDSTYSTSSGSIASYDWDA